MMKFPFSFSNAGQRFIIALALGGSVVSTAVWAKLPAPIATPETAAKAEEAKLKAAEATKLANAQLATSQDKVATHWSVKVRAQGKEFKPTQIAVPAAPTAATAPLAPKK
jgi:hypothetical protein